MTPPHKLMLINPLACTLYGVWFIVQPDGYLRYVGLQDDEFTPAVLTNFIGFGAILLALAYAHWVLIRIATPQNLHQVLKVFAYTWFITAAGIVYSLLAYADAVETSILPLIEAALFAGLGAWFLILQRRAYAARPRGRSVAAL